VFCVAEECFQLGTLRQIQKIQNDKGGDILAYYAFKSKSNGKYITGTDFRNGRRQIMSEYHPPLLVADEGVEYEIKHREISPKQYKTVRVELKEIDE
jgi:hypothetical protein